MHLILFNQGLCVVHEEMNKNVRKDFWIHPLFFLDPHKLMQFIVGGDSSSIRLSRKSVH